MTDARLDYLREPWRRDAACKDLGPGLFFPGPGEGHGRVTEAHYLVGKAVCAQCPVREECLSWALDERVDDGLWGGLTPRERFALGG